MRRTAAEAVFKGVIYGKPSVLGARQDSEESPADRDVGMNTRSAFSLASVPLLQLLKRCHHWDEDVECVAALYCFS